MKYRYIPALLACAAFAELAACAVAPEAPGSGAAQAAEPVIHEYRTGSGIASREHHVTTPEERKAAEEAAAAIRAQPGYGKTGI